MMFYIKKGELAGILSKTELYERNLHKKEC
jgi:hypothetical protein